MKHVLTIVGARPQFVKAAMVSRAFAGHPRLAERIIHTGQHYDPAMSDVFFREMGIPQPYRNLDVHEPTHARQTARMMVGIEEECLARRPDLMLVYGDTNSTLAGALVAAKLGIPVAHVEAGLRSHNRAMPEETNRVLTDHLAELLLVPHEDARAGLAREGITRGVHVVGDVMIDAIRTFREIAEKGTGVRPEVAALARAPYFFLTVHRQENTDSEERFRRIVAGLAQSPLPVVFPTHPRTKGIFERHGLKPPPALRSVPPVTYVESIYLQLHSRAVWTDSGGVQKEAVVLGKPCFTLRDQTEWTETVAEGWNHLVRADAADIVRHFDLALGFQAEGPFPTEKHYGNGRAAAAIVAALDAFLGEPRA